MLQDEQSDYIFALRLAEHIRQVSGICDERADPGTGRLLEILIDDAEMQIWYVFEACLQESL